MAASVKHGLGPSNSLDDDLSLKKRAGPAISKLDQQYHNKRPSLLPSPPSSPELDKPEQDTEAAPHQLDSIDNLSELLAKAAVAAPDAGLLFYSSSNVSATGSTEDDAPIRWTYSDLLAEAQQKARLISKDTLGSSLKDDSILLLHFDSQKDTILWFWAVTLAGYLPAISTPFVNDKTQRAKHLNHLNELFSQPVIITSKHLVPEFLEIEDLNLHDVETIQTRSDSSQEELTRLANPLKKTKEDAAVLMLTSGSTGNVKAVPLRHGQVMQAVQGKSEHHGTVPGDAFLNWVGMDHVASLTEIHLHAMSLGSSQVHVPASDLLRNPLDFVRLLERHEIAYTFGPNFFLSLVSDSLAANPELTANLSKLKALISGGESNTVSTCDELTRQLRRLGLEKEVIRPGFGMTETCAGSIYSRACPSYDLARNLEFASLGSCIPGLQMRVMSMTEQGRLAAVGESGEFQVAGPVVFRQYYNNPQATQDSFTSDGWFITGDVAWIDDAGNLNLAGRNKDTIIVNGVKWSATELESAIEEERIQGLEPSYTVAFPTRQKDSPTEDIAVVYSPTYDADDTEARFETAQAISKVVSLMTGTKPARLIPLPVNRLEKSSLGKISRTKVRAAMEKGDYASFEEQDQDLLQQYQSARWRCAETETERLVQGAVAEILNIEDPAQDINMNASIFDLGMNSFNLILLKSKIQKAVNADIDIPMSFLLVEPTVGAISSSIDNLLSQPTVYNPIVPLRPTGSGTPLFCIHPGSGDILVFIALAAHFSTRPVYALRTRGYNPNERLFHSIPETAETYAHHIRQTQPEGPYAIAGYSLGSTLAFEVGKVLESQGQQVKFLASIDYPPHIAHYVQNLNWVDVLLHIAFFLELIDEQTMVDITPHLHTLSTHEEALEYVLKIGDQERAKALAIDNERLRLISNIAENFRVNVEDYEPLGQVDRLDVFVADPPTYAANGRQDWRDNKLGKWTDFSKSPVEFHDCPGIHAKMLNKEHMADFAKIFKAAMRRRGV